MGKPVTIQIKAILNAPWERVGEVLNSAEFNVEGAQLRDGVVSAEHHLIDETAARKRFEIRTREHARTMKGDLDRSKIEDAKTAYDWDARARTQSWTYHSPPSTKMVRTWGVYTLKPMTDGTEVVHDVSVEVNVPIIGGQIAKVVAKEFEKAFGGTVDRLKRALSH
ncbi:MAG: DUF2505 family protein [Bradymonadales bacterium]|nr:DUF2505 family protein [Bradymonadales bacterium]